MPIALILAMLSTALPPAHAGTTWDGGGANTNVTTAGNWTDDSAPPFSSGTSTLTFAVGGTSATLDTQLNIARLLLNAAGPFSIGASGGNTLTLQGESVGGVNTGITAATPWLTGSGTYTLSAPVILGADQSWNVANGSGTTTLLVSGPISGSGRSLTKLGTGVLALAGANTYTGMTNVNAGTVELRTGASLAGPIAIAAPGTLRFANGQFSTTSFANAVSGAGSLSVTGGGAVQLTGANSSFTGSTSVTSGELAITSAAALGSGTSAIIVVGIPNSMSGNGSASDVKYAYYPAGGQLAIVSGAGLTLSRNLQLSGMGMRQQGTGGNAANISSTLRSTGNNVLSGTVQFSNASLQSSFGTLELAGGITTAVSSGTATLGGAGNVVLSGPVSLQSGVLQLAGGMGTVRLTNASNSISQITLAGAGLSGGVVGTQTGLEVATATVLGGARISQAGAITSGAGRLQIRTAAADAPGFGAANVTYIASGLSSYLYIDNARGGSDLNQTVALRYGWTSFDDAGQFFLAGGHGYGLSLTGTGGGTIFSGALRGAFFGNASNGLLTINADVSSAPSAYNGMGFLGSQGATSGGGTGDILFNGSFRISNANTAMPLLITTPARVVMTGTQNQMTGVNNLQNGTLAIRGLGALASGTINIGNAAQAASLEFLGATTTGAGETWTRAINLAGTTGGGYLYANQAGTSPTALVINGPITASGSGAKTFVLGGSSTLDNTIATSIPTSGSSTVMSLQKTGAGTWVLSGTNAYTGATTVSGGVLKLQAGAGDIVQNASAIVFDRDAFTNTAAGTLSYLGANNATSTETVGALTPTAGAARIIASGSGTGSATLTFASLGTRTAGATVDFATTPSGTIAFTSGPAGTSGILGGWATFGGVDWVNSGATASRFTGYTALDASSNSTSTNFSLSSGSVALPGAAGVNSLKLAGSSGTTSLSLGGLLTNTTGGVVFDNSLGSAQITGSQLGAAASEVIIHTGGSGGASNVLTVGSLIGSGASSLTKSGSGTLLLTANNAYTGNTTINEGTVRLSGASAALGAITTATNVTTLRQGGTLDINAAGSSSTVTIGMLNGAGLVTNSGAGSSTAGTLSIGNSTTTTGTGYFTGIMQDGAGRLGVTKAGATSSIQFLTGANTYTGPTTISSGTLAVTSLANIGQASGIGRGDNTSDDTNAASLVFNGGVLQYTGANGTVFQATQTPSVSIDRLFTLAGNGTIDSSGRYGDNDLTVAGNQNSATLILSNTGAVRFSGAAGSRTLTLQGAVSGDSRGNMSFDNQIALLLADGASNTLALTKAGNSLWKLTNTGNSYSGATTVSAGMLEVGDDSAAATRTLSQNSNLNLSGGFLVSSGTFSRAVGTAANQVRLTGAANTGFAAGASDLVVNLGSGTLSWGSTNFNPGTLYLSGPTSLGAVTFASPIDLNNGARTISVVDNVNSTFDYAIVSGVISGAGGLTKTGPFDIGDGPYGGQGSSVIPPALRLTGLNTFTGTTTITTGPLVVETIGNSASASSNLGAGSAVVEIGSNGSLDYIGAGETTNRQIRNSAANRSVTINNNGSGPLVLTNLVMAATSGVSTLTLGGFYPGANEVRSNLAPTASGTINLTLPTNSTWTLSGTNTLGTVLIGPGAILGIGSDTALNASAALTAGAFGRFPQIAAVGGARTVANNISLSGGGSNFGFTGDNSITYSGTLAIGSNDRVFLNNAIAGGTLSITGPIANSANPVSLKGSGQTVLSGSLAGSGAVAYFSADSTAALTLSGNYAGNTTSGVTNNGPAPIIFTAATAIPGTGANLTGAAGSTLATGYAVDQAFLGRIAAGSLTNSFAVGLAADSSNNLDFSSAGRNLTNASLGAVGSVTRVYNGTLTPNGTTYRLGGGGGTLDFQSALTGASNTLTVGGDVTGLGGTVILSNTASSFTGKTTVNMGILQISSLANVGAGNVSSLGAPTTTPNGTIDLGSGTSAGILRYVGTGHTSNRVINLAGTTGGGTLDASGSGPLVLTSANTATGAGTKTFTLTGTSTAANSIDSIAGSGVGVDKTGSGLWRLTGASGYGGQLRVLDGTLVVASSVDAFGSVVNGPFGSSGLPIIGSSAAGLTGTAALLVEGGLQINRGMSIAALGAGASQVAVLGITGAGESTFGGGQDITLSRSVTLQASNSGTVRFANNWVNASGPVAFTIGSEGNAGVVVLESALPTATGVSIVRGTARLQQLTDDRIGSATPVTIGSAGGPATLDINGQSQTLSNLTFAGNSSQITGGTLRLANTPAVAVTGTGHVISSLVALDAAASFNVNAASRLKIESAISGNSTLTKTGAGILELSGQNTYTGDTTVSAGTLVVNGSLGAGSLSVATGATLMGSGTVGGLATIAGIHSPGNSPGIETFSSNLTYSGGSSQVVWELWGNTTSNSPLAYDQIVVGGNLDFAGATSLLLDFGGSGVGAVNWNDAFWDTPKTWTLFSVAGTTTNFGNFSLTNSPTSWFDTNGLAFSSSSRSENTFSVSQSGNNVVVTYTVIVPEPGSIALAGIGIAAAAWAYRRRRK